MTDLNKLRDMRNQLRKILRDVTMLDEQAAIHGVDRAVIQHVQLATTSLENAEKALSEKDEGDELDGHN